MKAVITYAVMMGVFKPEALENAIWQSFINVIEYNINRLNDTNAINKNDTNKTNIQ